LPTDLVSHGVDELVHVGLQEVVEAGHAPELVVLPDNLLAVLHSALSNTAVHKTSFLCCGSGTFNPDPNFFYPGNKKISVPDPLHRIQVFKCCGSGMFNPDPNFFHPGSRLKKISDPDPIQRIQVFLRQQIVSKLSEI
jgi:hypothetical protein